MEIRLSKGIKLEKIKNEYLIVKIVLIGKFFACNQSQKSIMKIRQKYAELKASLRQNC